MKILLSPSFLQLWLSRNLLVYFLYLTCPIPIFLVYTDSTMKISTSEKVKNTSYNNDNTTVNRTWEKDTPVPVPGNKGYIYIYNSFIHLFIFFTLYDSLKKKARPLILREIEILLSSSFPQLWLSRCILVYLDPITSNEYYSIFLKRPV